MPSFPVIAVVGPTASGKSALAVRLAQKFNGEIISADSRQVYQGLNIGSGKLEVSKRKSIKHHLLDVVSPRRQFTVTQYQKLANRAMEDIASRGKVPIICGGTGLYVNALCENLVFPPAPPNAKLRRQLEEWDDRQLFQKLGKLDPERAKNIDRQNRRRLIRAIEIAMVLGKVPPLKFKAKNSSGGSKDCLRHYHWLMLGIKLDPDQLRKKINTRLKLRISHGLISEVKKLHRNGLSWVRLDIFGLEYRFVVRYLRKLLTKEQMVRELETAIWHYAKRQMTWWKRNQIIHWIKNYHEAKQLAVAFLKKSGKMIK